MVFRGSSKLVALLLSNEAKRRFYEEELFKMRNEKNWEMEKCLSRSDIEKKVALKGDKEKIKAQQSSW